MDFNRKFWRGELCWEIGTRWFNAERRCSFSDVNSRSLLFSQQNNKMFAVLLLIFQFSVDPAAPSLIFQQNAMYYRRSLNSIILKPYNSFHILIEFLQLISSATWWTTPELRKYSTL